MRKRYVVPRRLAVGRSLVASFALLVSVAGCGRSVASEAAAPTDTPPASVVAPSGGRALPTTDGEIEAGMYRVVASPWSVVDFTVALPDGWHLQYGHIFNKHADGDDELAVYPVVVDRIHADACVGSNGAEVETGTDAEDLSTALARQGGPRVSVMPTRLGGYDAIRVDMAVKEGFDLSECNMRDIGLQVWYSAPADKNFVLLADAAASVYILDVTGGRQVFLTQVGAQASEDDRAELQDILDSIRIEP